MSVLVQCAGCQAKLSAPASTVGNKVKCPICGAHVAVPAGGGAAAAPATAKNPGGAAAFQAAPAAPFSNDSLRTADDVARGAAERGRYRRFHTKILFCQHEVG